MTVFLSISNGKLNIENSLPEVHMQVHEHLIFNDEDMDLIFLSDQNDKNIIENVDTRACKKGDVLISGTFLTCNAVVVKLKNGQYAMHHSADGARGIIGEGEAAKNVREFFNSIKDQMAELYIFEKNQPISNAGKAPELTVALLSCVDPSVKVNRYNIEGYHYVICDSHNDQILLCKKAIGVENVAEAKEDGQYADVGHSVNVATAAIPIEETIKQVTTRRFNEDIVRNQDGNFIYKDNLMIPARFADYVNSKTAQENMQLKHS